MIDGYMFPNHLAKATINKAEREAQAICESMAEMQKQGKSERPKRSLGRSKSGSKAAQPQMVRLSDEQPVASEADLKGEKSYNKAETSSSPVMTESGESGDSSPLLYLTFGDVSEPQWESMANTFNLQKYPSEIDWAALL